jgi:serine/threonine protein kinase
MKEMLEKCVVHRDIKNANIFINIPEKKFRSYFDPIFD